eukprot:scaffold269526_cov30-Tisochrysis_lutea.AAC.2
MSDARISCGVFSTAASTSARGKHRLMCTPRAHSSEGYAPTPLTSNEASAAPPPVQRAACPRAASCPLRAMRTAPVPLVGMP